MSNCNTLVSQCQERFGAVLLNCAAAFNEVTIDVEKKDLLTIVQALRDEENFRFECLMDLCGVDYATYGISEWTTEATGSGFGRAVARDALNDNTTERDDKRFAVVYHLLSIAHNHRVRLRVFASEDDLIIPSVTSIWSAADWFEREAFDLYGILFEGHNDLRRLLTDYGFKGHPFRKDFPLIGEVEMRYDATLGRCVYEPVSIEPRVLVPRVIRDDQRYSGHPVAASTQADKTEKETAKKDASKEAADKEKTTEQQKADKKSEGA